MTRAGGREGDFTKEWGRLYEKLYLQGAMEVCGDDVEHQGLKRKLDSEPEEVPECSCIHHWAVG